MDIRNGLGKTTRVLCTQFAHRECDSVSVNAKVSFGVRSGTMVTVSVRTTVLVEVRVCTRPRDQVGAGEGRAVA